MLHVADHLAGRALAWYTEHVILARGHTMPWTFEEVIIGLYDRFVHPSAMEDARQDLEQVVYTPAKGVQGVFDEMLSHARNMAETPDNHTLVKSFLNALPSGWQKRLFRQGLSPVVNQISEFVGAAKALEIMDRTAQLYEQYSEKRPSKKALEPVKMRINADRKGIKNPQNKWKKSEIKPVNLKSQFQRKDRDSRPRADDKKRRQRDPEKPRTPRDNPDEGKGKNAAGVSLCFNCNQPGHYALQCPRPRRKPDQMKAAHTELPNESGDEGDTEDAEESVSARDQEDETGVSGSESEPEDLIEYEVDDGEESSDGE